MAIDNQLNLWICDAGNRRLVRMDGRLNFVDEIPYTDDEDALKFGEPSGIAVTNFGSLWVSDLERDRVAVFDNVGQFEKFVGDFGAGATLYWQWKQDQPFHIDNCFVPSTWVPHVASVTVGGYAEWEAAKREKNFQRFAPALRRLVELSRQKADCFGWEASPWDALAQDFERGITARKVETTFQPLLQATRRLLDRIAAAPPPTIRSLDQNWEIDRQREFGARVARDLGFDFEAGRQDVSAHPFSTTIGFGDVRITTRFRMETLQSTQR